MNRGRLGARALNLARPPHFLGRFTRFCAEPFKKQFECPRKRRNRIPDCSPKSWGIRTPNVREMFDRHPPERIGITDEGNRRSGQNSNPQPADSPLHENPFFHRTVGQTRDDFCRSDPKGSREFESPSLRHRVPISGYTPPKSAKSPPQRPHLQRCGRRENHFPAVIDNSRPKSLLANAERPFGPCAGMELIIRENNSERLELR